MEFTLGGLGSWEDNPPKELLLIATPHTGLVNYEWAVYLKILQSPCAYNIISNRGLPIDRARCDLVEQAKKTGATHIFFLDSVAKDTPILIRDKKTKLIDILPISDIITFDLVNTKQRIEINHLEVWSKRESDSGWVSINAIIRHPYKGKLKKIQTGLGIVKISGNHSIYLSSHNSGRRPEDNLINTNELKVNDLISHPRLRTQQIGTYFLGREDLAWLYGFFAAEGSICHGKSGNTWRISNSNIANINKCKETMEDYFNRACYITEDKKQGYKSIYHLQLTDKGICQYFEEMFYTSEKTKKIPPTILNAPSAIKLAFLRGYNEGDGYTKINTQLDFHSFTTNSPVLATGLIYLLNNFNLKYRIYTRNDKKEIIQISIKKDIYKRKNEFGITKIEDVDYDDYVYDISTENEKFCGGIGNMLLHNSDVLVPHDGLLRLWNHKLPVVAGIYGSKHQTVDVWLEQSKSGDSRYAAVLPQVLESNQLFSHPDIVTGLGCCLIDIQVFNKLEEPFFLWTQGREKSGISEDFYFFEKVRKAGIPIHIDTSVRCGHIDYSKLDWTGKRERLML